MCQRNFKLVELKFVLVYLEVKVEWQMFVNHILYRGPPSFFFFKIFPVLPTVLKFCDF